MLDMVKSSTKANFIKDRINAIRLLATNFKAIFECCILAINIDVVSKIVWNCPT